MKMILGVGLPLVIAFIWGLFASPAAPYKVGNTMKLVLEIDKMAERHWRFIQLEKPFLH